MRVLPFLFVIFLLTSVLAVPVPLGDLGLPHSPSSDWHIYTVDSAGDVGLWTSLALDSNGIPHIAYFDWGSKDLKYAHWNGSGWFTETVDSSGNVGWGASLAVDSNGYPHVSYSDFVNADLKYARWNGSVWDIEVVDFAGALGWPGHHTSIALDSNDYPQVAYYSYSNEELRFAQWNGSVWEIEVVDSDGYVGEFASLALDSNEYPHVSYSNRTDYDLKYAMWTGTAWNIQTVDTGGRVGEHSSLALDSNDYPHICYRNDSSADLKYARWNGSGWETDVVDAAVSAMWTSIAIDHNDKPHMSYHAHFVQDIRYAKWNVSDWDIETVDSSDNVGDYTSIALDSSDSPHVSYFKQSDWDLRFASRSELRPLPRPSLSYAPDSLDFGVRPQGFSGSKTFEIWNSGDGSLTYSISESISWIGVNPPNGSSTGEHDTINVTIDTTSLSEGLYTGFIFITSNGGNGTVNVFVEVLAPSRSITLDIDPNTLNLKSKGRWITAYLSAEDAFVYDIDISSILLQDILEPERWDYQEDILMLKFNRHDLIAMLEVGESVGIKLSGKWKDGTAFEAYDHIRAINPGKK